MEDRERESEDLISASMLAGIRKFQSNLGWTELILTVRERTRTTSNHQRTPENKTPLFCIREAVLCQDCISRRDGKYFKEICLPKYSKEHKVGS